MDERSQEETNQVRTGLSSFIQKLFRPGPLILIFSIAFLGMVTLGYYVLNTETPPPSIVTPPVSNLENLKVYEEETPSSMEDLVKQADLAIIETIRKTGLDMGELGLLDVEIRKFNGHGYHYQVLQMPKIQKRGKFIENLKAFLQKRLPEALLTDHSTEEVTILINTLPTHRLLLETVPLTLPKPLIQGPKLAIVIDDVGENMKVLKGLVNLDFPVTLAVWPNASFTRAAVEMIAQKRRDLIIHFPMEPKGYPKYNPGDDALFVTMSANEIRQRVKDNVAMIPEAIGVNNHMGSQFTANSAGMNVALAEFKKHGLFFLDSLTSSQSVARGAAKSVDIPFYERDIFIDNVKDVTAIIHQLKKAEKVARSKGYAVAIGHPYPETLAALKKWNSQRDVSLQLLPLSKLSPEK